MLRRTIFAALVALCVATPALADPGDGWRGRWREHNGQDSGRREEGGGPRAWGRRWGAEDGQGQSQGDQGRWREPPQGESGRWREGGEGPRRWGADAAREGVREGRLRPLGDIMGELHGRFGGRLLGQELANDGPRTIYRIRWMTADGRRLDLVVPADSR